MTIHAKQFPLDPSGLRASIRYQTDIIVGRNGQEVRNAVWQDPLYSYNAAFAVKSREDVATLQTFFHSVKGREIAFYLKDAQDYAIPQSGEVPQTIGTGTGAATTFQIYKNYTDSLSNTYQRTIRRLPSDTSKVDVWVNEVAKSNPGDYTYSTTTGIITFGAAPSNGHTITVVVEEFYVPVRFDIDQLDVDLLMFWVNSGTPYSLGQIPEIPMVEVRE